MSLPARVSLSGLCRPVLLPVSVLGCLLLAGCTLAAPARGDDGTFAVSGSVSLGPSCPVEVQGSPCPSQVGIGGRLLAEPVDGSSGALSFPLDGGSFSVDLPPGRWLLSSDLGMSCTPVEVSHAASGVVVSCDTGIR